VTAFRSVTRGTWAIDGKYPADSPRALAGRDGFWQDCGRKLAGAGSQKPRRMSIYVGLQGRITGCLLWVATEASDETVVCHDWATLKDALQKGQTFAYDLTGSSCTSGAARRTVAIVANAESERGHNAPTAFPVYLDEETLVTPSNRTSGNTSVCQIPFGIRTRVFSSGVDGDQPSASRRTLCHGGRIPSSGWVGGARVPPKEARV
jgi:hypothetical protein